MNEPTFADDPLLQGAFAWASSQAATEPMAEQYCPTRDVFTGRIDHCRSEAIRAGMTADQSFLLHAVLGEIGNNAFDHNIGAWKDLPGILFSWQCKPGTCSIVIADRGQGILQTLRQVRPALHSDEDALHVAFLERLSGRAPERRGNGLKFVRSVLLEDGLNLAFQSGNARYAVMKKQELWSNVTNAVPGCIAVVSWKAS
ncbi:MAG: hypothetical protein PHZ00_00225 [Candidatus Peribacteraceae bacterium]|nr:hypothetical protein [Candidatus Peribacteraceae bacterium]